MSFTGFLVRDTLADNGTTPTNGAVSQSPDVIPYQSGILTDATVVSTYTSNPGLSLINGAINNIYIRGKNLNSTSQKGSARLYYTPSTLLAQPSQWTNNQVLTAGGSQTATFEDATTPSNGSNIGAGDICVATFQLTSVQAPPPKSHYCFVAISTLSGESPNVPASFSSNSAFVNWVQSNPNVAWRNFSFQPPNSPTIVSHCLFGNLNNTSAQMVFMITATNCPTNTAVLFQCTTMTPPINVTINLPKADSEGNQTTSTTQSVPANFSGTMMIQATAPTGESFGTNYTFEPSCMQIVDNDTTDEFELKWRQKRTYPTTRADGTVEMTSSYLMTLGQVNLLPGSGS